jgi:hypothetical protein
MPEQAWQDIAVGARDEISWRPADVIEGAKYKRRQYRQSYAGIFGF